MPVGPGTSLAGIATAAESARMLLFTVAAVMVATAIVQTGADEKVAPAAEAA